MSWFGWGGKAKEEEEELPEGVPEDDAEEPISSTAIQTGVCRWVDNVLFSNVLGGFAEAPSIAKLLDTHKDSIDELRAACKDVLVSLAGLMVFFCVAEWDGQGPEHDDIWLLRYVLSRKTVDKAEPAVRKGIEWRNANKSWLDKAKEPGGRAPYADQIERFTAVDIHKRNCDGGAVMIIRAGLTPAKQLMEVATVAQLTDWFMFLSKPIVGLSVLKPVLTCLTEEKTFLICDEATRRTGKLVKVRDVFLWECRGCLCADGVGQFVDCGAKRRDGSAGHVGADGAYAQQRPDDCSGRLVQAE